MIVGGDSHFAYLMQRYIIRSDHKMITTNPGEDPLEMARSQKPAAIVMAIDLPDKIGWSTLELLKKDPDVNQIPLIVCSWLDEKSRAMTQGADWFLRMPILYADFIAALGDTKSRVDNE